MVEEGDVVVYQTGWWWVDGVVVCGGGCFDDAKIHRAYNYHATDSRVVLIVDLARPPGHPLGRATGGHSDELDAFLKEMGG